MQRLRLIVAFGLVVLAIIWILQNTGAVQTRFLFVTVTMPQAALLAITILIGVGAGILLGLARVGTGARTSSGPLQAVPSVPAERVNR